MEGIILLRSWKSMLLRALLAVLFGVILLVWPEATTLVLLIAFGIFVIADGVVSIVLSIIGMREKTGWGFLLFRGILELLIGAITLARPGVTLVALIYVIAIWAIAMGFIEIVACFDFPFSAGSKVLLVIGGLLWIAIGVLLILFPGSGIVTVILLLGIFSIVLGIVQAVLSILIRKELKDMPVPA